MLNNEPLQTKINELLQYLVAQQKVASADIPNIDLYMDQVTTFMENQLTASKRSAEDKVLTKTMINNYSKYGLLPPSVKKKYSADHIIRMLFIYYLKPILSIHDINQLLLSVNQIPEASDFRQLYDLMMSTEQENKDIFTDNIQRILDTVGQMFSQIDDPQHRKLLEIFSLSYFLTEQAAAQKYMVQKLIDDYLIEYNTPPDKKNKPPKK